jgi:hypothetical protein
MRTVLGGAAVVSLLVGCGPEPAAAPEPTPTVRPTSSATPTTSPPPGTAHRIPDDFPLLAGLPVDAAVEGPDFGPLGPSRVLNPLVPSACGHRVEVPTHVDLLRAAWNNAEDNRERQLVTFETEPAAAAYADALLDLYRLCPTDRLSPDDLLRSVVVESDLSRHAGAISVLATYLGSPRPGLETLHVVRIGHHVLLAVTSNEGGAGTDPDAQAAAQRADDAAALEEVVAAMGVLDNAPDRPGSGPRGAARG